MARSRKQGEPAAWKPTGDPLADRISHDSAVAIAWWLDARGGLSYPINSLTKNDFVGIAWAAITAYTNAREEERKRLGLSVFGEDDAKLDQIVMGNVNKP